ncbi:amidohydrolase [Methanohalobium evestigatum Z-7303]|uniref:5'-deoxyadenosine deaminase n=1 Tax=Methanohalobium evestigatum (strain ATCC BAA-1072 / DSM 3721 / NBRC 107634 / OCM 161 / Z-7303) TaxID=644295 RepID=D7E8L5_METEZ|nr:amidohydrolase family protein [Methanohalobium evestigatum]ADI73686.1 amidohydrolase [Methanohalobium evestigatum Z-7303]
MADIIIKNGYILTMDSYELTQGVVVIENGTITEVAESTEQDADQIIDAKGSVVMPGFVNTHTHTGMTLLRGYADDFPLDEWLKNYIWPVEDRLTDEDAYIGTKLACLEMIKSGTTSFADMFIHIDKVAQAVKDSGMRAALSYRMIEAGNEEKGKSELDTNKRFINNWKGEAEGRIITMYGPHAPYTCSEGFLSKVKKEANHDRVGIHIHVLETESELNQMKQHYGMCSINLLDRLGFLGPDVLAAHCVWLSDDDIEILRGRGVHVSHNPVSNMKLASGVAPVPGMLDRGVNVSLGTDGCASNNNLDMFEEMKTAALLHKVESLDPTVLPARQVLEMATTSGARALGIKSGVLREGYNADVIIVDMNKPHLTPVYDIHSHLVYSASGSDVSTTIVDGRILMQDYEVVCMDEQDVLDRARTAAAGLVERAKF